MRCPESPTAISHATSWSRKARASFEVRNISHQRGARVVQGMGTRRGGGRRAAGSFRAQAWGVLYDRAGRAAHDLRGGGLRTDNDIPRCGRPGDEGINEIDVQKRIACGLISCFKARDVTTHYLTLASYPIFFRVVLTLSPKLTDPSSASMAYPKPCCAGPCGESRRTPYRTRCDLGERFCSTIWRRTF